MDSIKFTDNRQPHKVVYPLVPTLLVISLAFIAGKNTAVDIADYWKFNLDRLRSIIPELPETPISHDTVLRLLKSIKFDEFDGFILYLTQNIIEAQGLSSEKKIMSLDGQTPRAIEYTPKDGMKHPEDGRCYNRLYYVSLYDSTDKLVLAQTEVQDKENENKACLRLIDLIDCSDCIFTSDALNSQRALAAKIIEKGGDYCLAIKDNHKTLRQAISTAFDNAQMLDEQAVYYNSDTEIGHGRIESRTVIALPLTALPKRSLGAWAEDAQTVFFARTCSYDKKYGVYREPEIRYYISSLSFDNPDIAKAGYEAIRKHWCIENSLHYVLDVTFNQDRAQIKNRNYIRNKLLLNKLALNALRCAQPAYSKGKEVISIKRLTSIASYSPEEALKMLSYYVPAEE